MSTSLGSRAFTRCRRSDFAGVEYSRRAAAQAAQWLHSMTRVAAAAPFACLAAQDLHHLGPPSFRSGVIPIFSSIAAETHVYSLAVSTRIWRIVIAPPLRRKESARKNNQRLRARLRDLRDGRSD